jgi:potassium channel subfamily K
MGPLIQHQILGDHFSFFWSLLAIPTLTILISNMADAVGKKIGNITLFVSAFMILPGDEKHRTLIKETIHKVRQVQL